MCRSGVYLCHEISYMLERCHWGCHKPGFAEEPIPQEGLTQVVGAVHRRRRVVLNGVGQLARCAGTDRWCVSTFIERVIGFGILKKC